MQATRGQETTGFRCSELFGKQRAGEAWNDGTYSSVRKIRVTANDDTVTAIQMQYTLKGNDPSVKSKVFDGSRHGGTDGEETLFVLKPDEYLTKISGYYGTYNGSVIIRSLTFETNKGELGTVGQEKGTYFETTGNGQIVGFFGRADTDFLYAVGVYKYA